VSGGGARPFTHTRQSGGSLGDLLARPRTDSAVCLQLVRFSWICRCTVCASSVLTRKPSNIADFHSRGNLKRPARLTCHTHPSTDHFLRSTVLTVPLRLLASVCTRRRLCASSDFRNVTLHRRTPLQCHGTSSSPCEGKISISPNRRDRRRISDILVRVRCQSQIVSALHFTSPYIIVATKAELQIIVKAPEAQGRKCKKENRDRESSRQIAQERERRKGDRQVIVVGRRRLAGTEGRRGGGRRGRRKGKKLQAKGTEG